MIKRMIKRHDLTPVQRQMQTNFDDYYEETAEGGQGTGELDRLRAVIEDRRREKSLGESKLNGNRIEILDLYKEHSDNDPDCASRFQELPAYLENKSRNYDYLPLTKSTDYNHMIRRSHLNQQAMQNLRPSPETNIRRRLFQLRSQLETKHHQLSGEENSYLNHTTDTNIWENDGVIAARKLLKKNDNL